MGQNPLAGGTTNNVPGEQAAPAAALLHQAFMAIKGVTMPNQGQGLPEHTATLVQEALVALQGGTPLHSQNQVPANNSTCKLEKIDDMPKSRPSSDKPESSSQA